MFSNTVKYAIKAVLYLAAYSDESNKIMIKDIANPINVPMAYIAKILQDLSRKNLVSSKRGPKGGFYLSDNNLKGNVHDLIEAVEGDDRISSCLLSLSECNASNPCSLHDLAYKEKQFLMQKLKETTLKTLAQDLKEGKTVLPL
ncbi:RrF2 family transcriptional regulator [Winogradskyella vincentii]|uniref:Rrf2 family transcriptional regulator n=1 Tax=Winogradskyella vincentii TaxID=2877122 RepID=A0ABS7XZW1_9FLAO|nr:Rrf2 family transcriptional regulator [Winogradskyella vincentii]MCA0152645.1 Rrf2 family transcriptional regulator [Winogradskyella vincentii]